MLISSEYALSNETRLFRRAAPPAAGRGGMPMSDPSSPFSPATPARQIAEAVIRRAPQDAVFVIRFLGLSQDLMHGHFRDFITGALARAGATSERHPMVSLFIDAHARELRDFVFTGVALSHPLRLPAIEALTGDAETLLRVDIWDALASHIESAQSRFMAGIDDAVAALREAEAGVRRRESGP